VFKLPDLPYAYGALEPTVSKETMTLHHDKHHARYVTVVNEICEKDGLNPSSLEELILKAAQDGKTKLFNNAAQAWNHAFFWECMTPDFSRPEGELAQAIGQAFGGLDKLKAKFVDEGFAHFGSGWVWLAASISGLEVVSTHDGENLLGRQGTSALLACDLWEHAYYVDYKNDRKSFLQKWFDDVANWSFAARQFAGRGQGQAYSYPAPQRQAAHA
jgi:Fe-Mn family superoxide dismutase